MGGGLVVYGHPTGGQLQMSDERVSGGMREVRARAWVPIAVVLSGLVAGIFGAWLLSGRSDGSGATAISDEPSVTALVLDRAAAPPPAAGPSTDTVAGVAAPDPRVAVEQFLTAEAAGDFPSSWKLLSAADRELHGSEAGWISAHADIPPLTGFQLHGADVTETRAEVHGEARLRAGLDERTGLTPPRAEATWVAVPQSDGWGVAFSESSIRPLFAPDTEAPAAVSRWAASRQACEPAGERTVLLGTALLADPLCGLTGEIRVGTVGRLEAPHLPAFVTAFGPEAAEWARTVRVEHPVRLVAVVAPVDDTWVVIGILQPTTTGGS